jgi:shikimate kinase
VSRRHLVLVGLSGSGKTTAGSLAAGLLGAGFCDLDAEIEKQEGESIAAIFSERGEVAFRLLERACLARALAGAARLVAAGAGCFADDESRRLALGSAYCLYLSVTPREAALRLGGAAGRPLLAGADPGPALERLLELREAAYLEAHAHVATGGLAPGEVARRIAELARSGGGW